MSWIRWLAVISSALRTKKHACNGGENMKIQFTPRMSSNVGTSLRFRMSSFKGWSKILTPILCGSGEIQSWILKNANCCFLLYIFSCTLVATLYIFGGGKICNWNVKTVRCLPLPPCIWEMQTVRCLPCICSCQLPSLMSSQLLSVEGSSGNAHSFM